ncbi:MAG TPA: AMP-binding protein [Phycisphaerae bacterium]|nr:AMP-binding protein [Phycisphaerae bacterium]HNU45544.1 AMP-binding protein [Phycisphaerae bacterium]
MWPVLTRHLIWPLHERLLGRATFRFLRELEDSQWLAPADVARLQERKLQALLRHAAANTRFYGRLMQSTGADPRHDPPLEVLRRLPPVSKADIREHLDEMTWPAAPGGLFPSNTGGSTGEPLIFYLDRRRQAYDMAARLRSHRWFGVGVGERELYLWGSPIEWSRNDRLKRQRDGLINHRLLSAFDMAPQRLDAYLDELERYQPACLFGYPSSLALLATHGRTTGRRLRRRRLRAVFVTGEVCHAHDRDTIRDYFGVPVADGYGSREAGFIAHECPEGNLHLTAENVVVEILRDDQPAATGEMGEIVVTHLDAYAQPFIRYRTGDVGRLRAGRCACGRGLPLMDVVCGRTTDFLYLPDGTVKHALSIIYPLRALAGVAQFRVLQDADYSVIVEVVRRPGTADLNEAAVAQAARPVLGTDVPLTVHLVPHIPASSSGKYRYVTSEVSRATAAQTQRLAPPPLRPATLAQEVTCA